MAGRRFGQRDVQVDGRRVGGMRDGDILEDRAGRGEPLAGVVKSRGDLRIENGEEVPRGECRGAVRSVLAP